MNDDAVANPEFTNWALNNHTFEKMGATGQRRTNDVDAGRRSGTSHRWIYDAKLAGGLGVPPQIGPALYDGRRTAGRP